jgi:hypothetical protein
MWLLCHFVLSYLQNIIQSHHEAEGKGEYHASEWKFRLELRRIELEEKKVELKKAEVDLKRFEIEKKAEVDLKRAEVDIEKLKIAGVHIKSESALSPIRSTSDAEIFHLTWNRFRSDQKVILLQELLMKTTLFWI